VLVAGRTPEKIAQVAQTIRGAGGSAEPVAMDRPVRRTSFRLFDRAMSPGDGHDPADLIVFNAGATADRFPRAFRRALRGVLADRLLRRFLVVARRPPARPLGAVRSSSTGASASLPRQTGFCAVCRCQGGLSHGLAEHRRENTGLSASMSRMSDRWRYRWRSAAHRAPSLIKETWRGWPTRIDAIAIPLAHSSPAAFA